MTTEAEQRNVNPKTTQQRFATRFPHHRLASTLDQVISSSAYNELVVLRNYLAHRAVPGRTFFKGGTEDGTAVWTVFDIPIDDETTRARRTWISNAHVAVLADAVILLDEELPKIGTTVR